MAIFITGDTHGDFTRFKKDIFYEQAELTKEDCVIITGDYAEKIIIREMLEKSLQSRGFCKKLRDNKYWQRG